jgi:Ser/Thr protein kinase RdoA (MazF antagonist)
MGELRKLSNEQQITRLDQVLNALLSRYGIEPGQRTLLQYEDNAVYRAVMPNGEPVVVRVATPSGRSAEQQLSEMLWLQTLRRDTGLAVPDPIPNLDGALVTAINLAGSGEDYQCVVLRWVDGELPKPGLSPACVERLGAFTGELHRQAERFVPPPEFVRPRWDWERLFGVRSILHNDEAMGTLAPSQRAVLEAARDCVQLALACPGKDALREGLIHGDLHRDNILFRDGEVGVIDFDDCGSGYYLFDLACVLDSFHRRIATGPEEFQVMREALLRGYDRVRSLPSELDEHLEIFMAMRDMATINFILGSQNANVHAWGHGRVAAIIDQLQGHLRTPSAGR